MASKDLKITFSGDTKSYRQEVDEAALATNKFQKDAGSAMSNLAGVFGVNTSAIKDSIDGMSKGFTMMLTSMKASADGATIWQTAMNIIKIATISTGIGALIVVVGSLVSYFTQTREGANFVKQAMAGLGAAVRVVKDHFSSFGEGIFKLFKGDWAGSAAAFKASINGIGTEMIESGKAATELEKREQALAKQERVDLVANAEMLARAAELRRDAKDVENFDAATRKKMLTEARTLITAVATEERNHAKEALSIFQGQIALRKASSDDLNEEVELKMKVSEIDRSAAQEQKALFREMKGVNSQINAQSEALIKLAEEKRKQAIADAGGKPKTAYANEVEVTTNIKDGKSDLKGVQKYKDQLNSANIAGKEAVNNLKTSTIDLSGAISGAMNDVAVGTGEMIGAFLAGGGSAMSFGEMIAGAFADMAITVGKIAIAAGIATIGIKAAFESMNGPLAIAAGIALVALGSAVKGRMKSVASGGASASSGGGNNGSFNYGSQTQSKSAMQNINITVAGELKAQGGTLVAVLNQEVQRKAATT